MYAPALRQSALLMAAWLLTCAAAFGWSEQGHRIVALAAEEQLSANSKRRVGYLFGPDVRLVDIATWADEIKQERPETEAWHSITIPQGASRVDLARDCPVGDCITVKVRDFMGIVRLAIGPKEEAREAFKMLVSLAADLHQPLLGGFPPGQNKDDSVVVLNNTQMTLFEAWDGGLLASLGSEEEILEQVRRRILAADKDAWTRGTLRDWTWENHQIAASKVYPTVGAAERTVLEGEALESATEIMIERLAKSAVRLAAMLEDMWP
jgi:hypothetical protein